MQEKRAILTSHRKQGMPGEDPVRVSAATLIPARGYNGPAVFPQPRCAFFPNRKSKVDSLAPHCRLLRSRLTTPYPFGAKANAFGQTGLQPSPVFTPAGQRIRAVHTHLPPAARAPSTGPVADKVCLCTMYDVRFGQAGDAALHNPAPFELPSCMILPTTSAKASHSPRLWRAIIQIVNRKS